MRRIVITCSACSGWKDQIAGEGINAVLQPITLLDVVPSPRDADIEGPYPILSEHVCKGSGSHAFTVTKCALGGFVKCIECFQ